MSNPTKLVETIDYESSISNTAIFPKNKMKIIKKNKNEC